MKKNLLTISILLFASISMFGQGKLIISEVADPKDFANAKFVELYNSGDATIDFSAEVYNLARQANGGSFANILLTGTLSAGSTYIIANNKTDFDSKFSKVANIYSTSVSGNGNDGYFIYKGGTNVTGVLSDSYGVVGEDGTGKPWEYTDGRAFRVVGTTNPNSTWTASEWNVSKGSSNVVDFNPGIHIAVIPPTALSDLKIDGVTVAGFNSVTYTYLIELPANTTAIPVVTYTTNDPTATAVVTPATDLTGNAAARTTKVTVTAAIGGATQDYTITFNPILEVANLAAFRTGDPTRTYVVTGDLLITYINTTRYQKFIQDATGGVMIDDPSHVITTTYAVGDIVANLKGKNLPYFGLIEFTPTADPGVPKSSGNPVIPELVTIAQLNANIGLYESKYVKLEKVKFVAANGAATFGSAVNYTVTDGTNDAIVRTNYANLDYIGGVIPLVVDLAGVTISYNGGMQVIPRNANDFLKFYSSVASLSDLKVSGQTVTGFAANTLTYTAYLAPTTTVVPAVTYTTTNAGAAVVVTNATNLAGDEAARTTTIAVTSEDGLTVISYKVMFVLGFPTAIAKQAVSQISVYPVPANDRITISGLSKVNRLELMDVTGKVIRKVEITGNEVILNISDLHKGMYFLRTDTQTLKFIKK